MERTPQPQRELVGEGLGPQLLMALAKYFLEPYIFQVITDPGTLIKLVIAKLGKNSPRALAIKTLRRSRNKIEHGHRVDERELQNCVT